MASNHPAPTTASTADPRRRNSLVFSDLPPLPLSLPRTTSDSTDPTTVACARQLPASPLPLSGNASVDGATAAAEDGASPLAHVSASLRAALDPAPPNGGELLDLPPLPASVSAGSDDANDVFVDCEAPPPSAPPVAAKVTSSLATDGYGDEDENDDDDASFCSTVASLSADDVDGQLEPATADASDDEGHGGGGGGGGVIEVFDVFFLYASVTSSVAVKHRQERLLSILRAKFDVSRVLMLDITSPVFVTVRNNGVAEAKSRGGRVPPWPIVVLQFRVVRPDSDDEDDLLDMLDPYDEAQISTAWHLGDESAERDWILPEEFEEALELGEIDALLQLNAC
ncbi:hypothetical protein H9P43_005332 [Blastocladiella emersonii ATCC 22665]|nr:hypothetical protein H9P43_005332 [Blastocladiella emersonii ATCC 22665]